jgi:hypothetical protein
MTTATTHRAPPATRTPRWLVAPICELTPDEYLRLVAHYKSRRLRVPNATNREQLEALADAFPDEARRQRPADPWWREFMGLPRWFGRVPPFSDDWCERFYQTLKDKPEFAAAVGRLIGGAE